MDRFERGMEGRDLSKKNRKIDKLERIHGLGAANRKMIKETLKNVNKAMGNPQQPKGGHHHQQDLLGEEMDAISSAFGELDDIALDSRMAGKLKLDPNFFEKIDDDFDDDLE